MKIIAKLISGSHLYGLNTPSSDFDYISIFLNSEISKIIGLEREHSKSFKFEDNDHIFYEVRHLLGLIRKGSTIGLEILHCQEFLEKSWQFDLIIEQRENLIDSKQVFKSLMGYIYNERKLFLGERTGLLGGKRKEALEKFGYSYKNAVQLLRLCYCGSMLFEQGFFPTNIVKHNPELGKELIDIKTNPQNYKREDLLKRSLEEEEKLKKSFDNRQFEYKFDENIANDICFELYFPILQEGLIKV